MSCIQQSTPVHQPPFGISETIHLTKPKCALADCVIHPEIESYPSKFVRRCFSVRKAHVIGTSRRGPEIFHRGKHFKIDLCSFECCHHDVILRLHQRGIHLRVMRLDKATKLFQLPCKSAPEIRNMRTIIQEVGKQCCVVFSVRVCSHFSRFEELLDTPCSCRFISKPNPTDTLAPRRCQGPSRRGP